MRIPETFTDQETDQRAIIRLTALWALAESGLGGVLFALRIPLTGFLIGAVSVVILSLIALRSRNRFRQLTGATAVVLMVKAAVSPHAPPAAYLAVSFQGLLAAVLFSQLASHRLACVLLGAITMAESALQKIIVLTLLMGKSLWEAVQRLGAEVAKTFGINAQHNYVLWLIGGYTLLYAFWGWAVGCFAARLPALIEQEKDGILEKFYHQQAPALPDIQKPGNRKMQRLVFYIGILAFVVLTFLLTGGKNVGYILLRSVAALVLLLFVVQPLLKLLFNRWLRNRSAARQAQSQEVLQLLPVLRRYLPAAYANARAQTGFTRRGGIFLLTMIVLSLYAREQHPAV